MQDFYMNLVLYQIWSIGQTALGAHFSQILGILNKQQTKTKPQTASVGNKETLTLKKKPNQFVPYYLLFVLSLKKHVDLP